MSDNIVCTAEPRPPCPSRVSMITLGGDGANRSVNFPSHPSPPEKPSNCATMMPPGRERTVTASSPDGGSSILSTESWKRAVPAALGNQLFDFLALYVSLLAVGSRVDPVLVLLAFVAGSALAMIPITPGGLGFVEAGLTGVLTLAGVTPDHAVLAVLLYRLFSYWLPLPAGLVASILFRRRHRDDRSGAAVASG